MSGSGPNMACRKRLRIYDSSMMKIQSNDDDSGVCGVKNRQTPMRADDQEKGEKMTMWNVHNKVKLTKKVSTASVEKTREKNCFANNKKKMQIDDNEGKNRCHYGNKEKNRKESATLSGKEKNKEKLNKTHKEKMWAADRKERKTLSGHNTVKNGEVSTAFFGKEKKGKRLNRANNEELQRDEDEEEEMWDYGSKVTSGKVTKSFYQGEKKKKKPNNTNTEKKTAPNTPSVKEKRMRPIEKPEMMRHKPNGRNAPSNVSKEKNMDISSGSNYKKRMREEPHTPFKKENRMKTNDSDKKIQSGRVQEKKICGSGKEKNRQSPFAFFKFMCYKFGEFVLIPPAVAPMLKKLTNHDVYLEDSVGRCSKVRLSVVDGSLAFHQGWNIFVSDHLIKWGEFLLFEYIARDTFYVRIFGIDSHERLCFEKDPERVEDGVGSGPVDNNNENLMNPQCNTKGTSPVRSKGKVVIMISDSGTSAHNEDIANLTTSDADSTHHVTINTDKDPKRVQSGIGNLPDGGCGTKCISPTCSEGKKGSEIIETDAAPLTHKNGDGVRHELEAHDLDKNLIREQEMNSIPLDSITAVDKLQNHGKMNISPNFCRKYAAPCGFRCLEKWSKGNVNNQAAVDGTLLVEPENTQETDSKLVNDYGSLRLNSVNEYFCSEGNHTHVPPVFTMPVKVPPSEGKKGSEIIETDAAPLTHKNGDGVGHELEAHDLDKNLIREQGINSIPLDSITAVDKHQNHGKMNISPNFCRKYAAPCGFRCLEKWSKGNVNNQAAVDGTLLVEPENTQETDSKLVNDYGSLGLNTVNEYFCSEGNHTHVPPVFTMPVKVPPSADRVSKYRHGETEFNHGISEKGGGAAVQIETQGEQLEPVGSIVNSQRNHILMSVNAVVPDRYGALGLNSVIPEGTCAFVETMLTVPVVEPSSPDGISKCGSSMTEINHNVNGKGTIVQPETKMDQVEPVGSSVCRQSSDIAMSANHVVTHVSEHCFSNQEGKKSINRVITECLLPVEDRILELDDHSPLKFSLQLCIPDNTRKWLELPKSLSNAIKQKRQDRNIVILKDPMKRLWPVLYHENPVFVGFTAGWKHFVAANNLQTGDLCKLIKEPDDDESVSVHTVQMIRSQKND